MHRLDFFRRTVAHIGGAGGTSLSLYGLLEIHGITGLLCCAVGGALIGYALARLC